LYENSRTEEGCNGRLEEGFYLYDQVVENEAGMTCSTNTGEEEWYIIWVAKSERKRALGRPRRMRVNYIKMDLRDVGSMMCYGPV
jgi:hypothetical protein